MKKGNFKTDLKRGKVGEDAFVRVAENIGWVVHDKSDDPKYWEQDVDFIITDRNGKDRKCEVKWDFRINQTNNFFIETVSSVRIMSKGWIYKTQADAIFYGDAIGGVFYLFKPKEMIDYCNKYKPRSIDWYNKETGTTVRGFLVNFHDYSKKGYTFLTTTIPQE